MANYEGKLVEEAIAKGLADLAITRDQADISVVTKPSNGFLGIGRKLAKVSVTKRPSNSKANLAVKPTDIPKQKATAQKAVKQTPKIDLDDISQQLADYLDDILTAMDLSFKLKLEIKSRKTIYIDIDTDEESRLIGRHGRTINDLQELSQIFIRRLGVNNVLIELDTAGYRDRRSAALRRLAGKTARDAIANGKPIYLNPMPSFERKEIHNALMGSGHVTTYSTGREPHRVVVVAPK